MNSSVFRIPSASASISAYFSRSLSDSPLALLLAYALASASFSAFFASSASRISASKPLMSSQQNAWIVDTAARGSRRVDRQSRQSRFWYRLLREQTALAIEGSLHTDRLLRAPSRRLFGATPQLTCEFSRSPHLQRKKLRGGITVTYPQMSSTT